MTWPAAYNAGALAKIQLGSGHHPFSSKGLRLDVELRNAVAVVPRGGERSSALRPMQIAVGYSSRLGNVLSMAHVEQVGTDRIYFCCQVKTQIPTFTEGFLLDLESLDCEP